MTLPLVTMDAPRCHNCGIRGHKTQNCAKYGPKYPAPGKTSQDYGDEAQRIMNLFAADIIAEHEGNEVDPPMSAPTPKYVGRPGTPATPEEVAARRVVCPRCAAQPEEWCISATGRHTNKSHRQRVAEGLALSTQGGVS